MATQMVNGGWYNGRQFWNGVLGAPGVITNPNQAGYGQTVSSSVQKQSNPTSAPVGNSNSSSPSSNQSPLEQVNNIIQDSFQTLQNEVTKRWGDYTAGNPFKVDQVLADKTNEAKEQVDPYYKQQLGDYMTGVQRKLERGAADTKDLLDELTSSSASYTQQNSNQLSAAVRQAQNGFADNGLFNSGANQNAQGQLTQASNQNITDYTRKANLQGKQIVNENQRNIEDLNLGADQYKSQNAADQYTAEQNRAADLTKTAGQQYVQGFQQTLPTQLQSASGFDMLKSLGIYS